MYVHSVSIITGKSQKGIQCRCEVVTGMASRQKSELHSSSTHALSDQEDVTLRDHFIVVISVEMLEIPPAVIWLHITAMSLFWGPLHQQRANPEMYTFECFCEGLDYFNICVV